ncbi:MAG: SIR2 family protein [Metamycoplasmataceae bacterium]
MTKEEKINNNENFNKLFKKTLEYTNINLLIGAGFNSETVGVLNNFKEKIEKEIQKAFDSNNFSEEQKLIINHEENNIENKLSLINSFGSIYNNEHIRETSNILKKLFIKELIDKNNAEETLEGKKQKNENQEFVNLLSHIANIRQNNQNTSKVINFFTLNYDTIIDEILIDNSYEHFLLTPKNIEKKITILDNISYDENKKTKKVRWNIIKLHGDCSEGINNIIIPFNKKVIEVTEESKYFELMFNMRRVCSKENSSLIIIGYSGNDTHINRLIRTINEKGTKIFFFAKKEEIEKLKNKEILINNNDFIEWEKESPVNICIKRFKEFLNDTNEDK